MTDVQSTPFGAALLAGKQALRALKVVLVTYSTGEFNVEIPARIGKTKFRIDTERQFNTRVLTRDYLIEIAVLRNPDTQTPFEPCEGHRIKETIGGFVRTYEVLPIADEPAWRESDTTNAEYRIHTKRIGQESVT